MNLMLTSYDWLMFGGLFVLVAAFGIAFGVVR